MTDVTKYEEFVRNAKDSLAIQPLKCLSLLRQLDQFDTGREQFLKKTLYLHGTHNIGYFKDYLRLVGYLHYIEFEITVADFDPRALQIKEPSPCLVSLNPEFVFFCTSWRYLKKGFEENIAPEVFVDDYLEGFSRLRKEIDSTFIIQNFDLPEPSSNIINQSSGIRLTAFIRQVNSCIDRRLSGEKNIFCVDINHLSGSMGWREWSDPRLWYTTKQHWSASANLPIAGALTDLISQLISHRQIKLLICDLDNTLWGGIAADDGISELRICYGDPVGEMYLDFQQCLKNLQKSGLVLAVSSKNDREFVNDIFRLHNHMPLSLDDFAVCKINWANKSIGIREIIDELNVSDDAVAFIDDNPREISEVGLQLPSVKTIHLKGDPASFPDLLISAVKMTVIPPTNEDIDRSKMYQENAKRKKEHGNYASENEFLNNLSIILETRPLNDHDIPRAVQLINKTNQFNLSKQRLTNEELSKLDRNETYRVFTCRETDKFGDNGLISVMIIKELSSALELNNWVVSCRVFNLGIERYFLKWCLKQYCGDGWAIRANLKRTSYNGYLESLFHELNFVAVTTSEGRVCYTAKEEQLKFGYLDHIIGKNAS